MSDAAAAFGAPADVKPPPGKGGYWLGALAIVAGVVLAIAWFVTHIVGLSDSVDDLQRVPVGASRFVDLPGGDLSIYYEDPRGVEDAAIPALRIVVQRGGEGAPLPIEGHSGSVSYSFGGHSGQSIAALHDVEAGRYRVQTSGPAPSGAQVAIGEGVGSKIVSALVGGFGIGIAGLLIGVALIVVTSTRRNRASPKP